MIREENLRLDYLCCASRLCGSHRERLIGGEKGHVDVLDVPHLGYVLSIAGNVYAETVEREDKAIITSFGMELFPTRSNIVGRNGIYGNVISETQMVAIVHDLPFPDDFGTVGIRNNDRRGLFQLSDSHRVAVIIVLMGNKDIVSLGHRAVIGRWFQSADGVDFYLPAVERDSYTAVFNSGESNLLSTLRYLSEYQSPTSPYTLLWPM